MTGTSPTPVLIVGAGPVGLCTGIALANAGHHVTILDSGRTGAGWASGGMLAPLYEMAADPACPDAFVQVALESAALWADIAKDCAITLNEPTVFLARTQGDVAALLSLQARANAFGQVLKQVAVPAGLTSMLAFEAQDERALEPRTALARLRTRFEALGGRVLIGEVARVGSCRLDLQDGRHFEAEIIVLAHGFGAAGLAQQIPALAALSPVKGQMLRLAAPELTAPIIRAGRIYLLSRGGSIVVGASSQPDAAPDQTVNLAPLLGLMGEVTAIAPHLAHAPIVESWSGIRPDTPDHAPIVGPSGVAGLYLATGTYRNGWLLAPAIGTYLCQLISGQKPAADRQALFAPARFCS